MNNKMYSKIIVLFILALGLNIQEIQAAEPMDLKLTLSPNQKHKMRMMSKISSSQTLQGQINESTHEEIMEVIFHVQDVNSQGDILMKVTFEKLQTKTKYPTSTIEFDSTKPDTGPLNPLAPTYRALIGQSFKIKVASNGTILELQSIDDMLLKMAEKVIVAEDEKLDKMTIQKLNQKYGTRDKRIERIKKRIGTLFGE